MGCHTEPAFVHIAHVMQKLHFFQFFNCFCSLHDPPQEKLHNLMILLFMSYIFHYCAKGISATILVQLAGVFPQTWGSHSCGMFSSDQGHGFSKVTPRPLCF